MDARPCRDERSNHGLRPGRKISWGISPATARASASREKKTEPPVAAIKPKPAPVEAPAIVPPSIEITGRVLREVEDYCGLWNSFRQRIDELGLTRAEVSYLAGLQEGYVGKLAGPAMVKKYGIVSLGATLSALGCKLVLVEDPEATAKVMERAQKRRRPLRKSVVGGEP